MVIMFITDLLFWSCRLKNFENLYSQLKEPKVKKMASILEEENSPYYDIFKSVFQCVVSGEKSLYMNMFFF